MSSKDHVVHIITRLDMGGSAQNTFLTLLHLCPQTYALTLITGTLCLPSASNAKERASHRAMLSSLRAKGVRIIELPHLVRSISPFNDLISVLSLTRLLKRLHPRVVHTHTSKAGFIGRIAARAARVPRVVHTPHGHVFWGHFGPVASWIFFQMERLACRITHHLVALTEGEANDYIRWGVMDRQRISIIPSGVALERFSGFSGDIPKNRLKLGFAEDALVVGFVGWLWPVKGVNYLLEAMKTPMQNNPRMRLVFVGQGDEEPALRSMAAGAELDTRVHFLGWRPDVHELLHSFDMLVLPSLNEGMGRVLVEAMAAGLPVIGTRVGGIPDLIKDEVNGLLVPPADAVALERAISRLSDDPEERLRMGKMGRAVSHSYSVEVMVSKINAVYERMSTKKCDRNCGPS